MQTNQYQNLTPKAVLKNLTVVHGALIAGQVLFAIVACVVNKQPRYFDLNLSADTLFIVAPVLTVACVILSIIQFKKQLQMASDRSDLKSKLSMYQTAYIVRMAPLEGASLFNIVVFLLKGNYFTLMIAGLIILYFISFRPTKDRAAENLSLSYEEQNEL